AVEDLGHPIPVTFAAPVAMVATNSVHRCSDQLTFPSIAGRGVVAPAKTARTEQQLAETVKTSMQEMFDSDKDYVQYHLQVVNVTVIHENGNKYNGIATLRNGKGTQHDVLVDVTATPNGAGLWHMQGGQLLWAMQDADYSTRTWR